MRPGPGLVVMALAFISGARRGSTSTSSKTTSLSPTFTSSLHFSSSSFSSTSSYTSSLPSTRSFIHSGAGVSTTTTAPSSDNQHIKQPYSKLLGPWYDPQLVGPESLQTESLSRPIRETSNTLRNTNIGASVGGGDGTDKDDNSRSSDSSGLGPVEALPVHFPSLSADSSASFDEDDILALVSEDELLSQESLDRLTQLTDDKIGYVNEGDYGAIENAEVGGGEDRTSAFGPHQHLQRDEVVREVVGAVEALRSTGYEVTEEQSYSVIDGDLVELVSSNVGRATDKIATYSAQQDLQQDVATLDFKQLGLDSPVFQSAIALTRINPWLSACDLAQPGTAPDLQGQCTAGTLPVAWVDEGPGPPTCPKSCEQQRLENNNNKLNLNTNNNENRNDNKYLIDENSINIRRNQLVNNNNNNNNYLNLNTMNHELLMLKVRREINKQDSNKSVNADLNNTPTATPTTILSGGEEAPQQQQPQDDSEFFASDSVDVIDDMTMLGYQQYHNSDSNSNNNNNNQFKQQSQNNNNIVKLNANHVNFNNYNLKYNSNKHNNNNLNREPSSRSSSNNNYNQFKQQQQQFANAENKQQKQHKILQKQRQEEQQQEQQQCLDYLGDNDEASPLHICQLKDPSALAFKLRSLRLRHCCERNVFSALHTIALNATMSGGGKCVRVLTDIMELDSLATRITCELAEILFRFDCRQVYSLIHQCNDCKEAYRRWVCSTLIPYFAEQNETIASNGNSTSHKNNNKSAAATTTTTSNSIPSNKHSNNQDENNDNNGNKCNTVERTNYLINSNKITHNNNNNNNQAEFKKNNIIENDNTFQNNKAFNSNINNDNNNNYSNDNLNKRSQRSDFGLRHLKRSAATTFHDVIDCYVNSRSSNNHTSAESELLADRRCLQKPRSEVKGQLQHGANHLISTATNEDLFAEDPVISRLLKRSKRKVEFRKRRRIRPCLSVCQSVEQKCPYLLPADRAPALPTQYAGEPTFLCLDPSIDETGEQRLKSNNGPNECCYEYCGHAVQGVCTYCTEFAIRSSDDLSQGNTTTRRNSTAAPTRHVHNITLNGTSSSSQPRKGSISIALLNASSGTGVEVAERLPYYAYYAGTLYYDDIAEMPLDPLPECLPVPSVSSRCTVPYYASGAAAIAGRSRTRPSPMRALTLCLSALFCLLNCGFAFVSVCRWRDRNSYALSSVEERSSRYEESRSSENGKRKRRRKQIDCSCSVWNAAAEGNSGGEVQRNSCRKSYREFRLRRQQNSQTRGGVKMKNATCTEYECQKTWRKQDTTRQTATRFCSHCRSRRSRISSKFSSSISTKLSYNLSSSCSRNHHFFHYFYNFNVNDLWRRWWIRSSPATRTPTSS